MQRKRLCRKKTTTPRRHCNTKRPIKERSHSVAGRRYRRVGFVGSFRRIFFLHTVLSLFFCLCLPPKLMGTVVFRDVYGSSFVPGKKRRKVRKYKCFFLFFKVKTSKIRSVAAHSEPLVLIGTKTFKTHCCGCIVRQLKGSISLIKCSINAFFICSNVSFCPINSPEIKDIQFTVIYGKEKQKFLVFVGIFCTKND